ARGAGGELGGPPRGEPTGAALVGRGGWPPRGGPAAPSKGEPGAKPRAAPARTPGPPPPGRGAASPRRRARAASRLQLEIVRAGGRPLHDLDAQAGGLHVTVLLARQPVRRLH